MEVVCNKCKVIYNGYEGHFLKHPNGRDGYQHTCNECRKKRRKTKEAKLKSKIYQKKWRDKNKEKDLEYQKLRRENPQFKPMYKAATANTKARKIGADGKLTKHDITAKLNEQKYKCHYCGCDITDDYEIDHIVPFYHGGENTPVNIVACCRRCNRSKWVFNDIKRTNNKRRLINKIKEQK